MKSHHARKYLLSVLCILIMGFWTLPAMATPISYNFTGSNVSGVFIATEFSEGSFAVSISGDTNNVASYTVFDDFDPTLVVSTGYQILGLTGTVSFAGNVFDNPLDPFTPSGTVSGFGTFADLLYVFVDNTFEVVGFGSGDPSNVANDLLDALMPFMGLAMYDLKSPFGPISGASFFTSDWILDIGTLAIEAEGIPDQGSVTFVTPEPMTMLLLGLGLIGLAGIGRKRS